MTSPACPSLYNCYGEKVFSAKDAIFSQSSLVKAPERMDGMLVLCIFYVYDQATSWS